jgi:hypothetical protein
MEIEADVSMIEEEALPVGGFITRLLVSPIAVIVNEVLANGTPPILPESVPLNVKVIGPAEMQVTVRNASAKMLLSRMAKKPPVIYYYTFRQATGRPKAQLKHAPGVWETFASTITGRGMTKVSSIFVARA